MLGQQQTKKAATVLKGYVLHTGNSFFPKAIELVINGVP